MYFLGTFPVIQWLRFHSSNASAVGSVRELRSYLSCNVAKKIFFKKFKYLCVCVSF